MHLASDVTIFQRSDRLKFQLQLFCKPLFVVVSALPITAIFICLLELLLALPLGSTQ